MPMNKRNSKASLKHRLLTRLGVTFVPERHVRVVFQDEMFHRVLGPGYHPPALWNERYGNLINTALRTVQVEGIQVRTSDQISANLNTLARFCFDPRHCASHRVTSAMVALDDYQLKKMVDAHVADAVRHACGNHTVAELRTGSHWPQLERETRHHLQRRLDSLGIVVGNEGAISIYGIAVPNLLDEANQIALSWETTANSLESMTERVARFFSLREMVRQSESFQLVLTETGTVSQLASPISFRSQANDNVHIKRSNGSASTASEEAVD